MAEAMESVSLHNTQIGSPQTVEGATSTPRERMRVFARKVIMPYIMEQRDEFRESNLMRQRVPNPNRMIRVIGSNTPHC